MNFTRPVLAAILLSATMPALAQGQASQTGATPAAQPAAPLQATPSKQAVGALAALEKAYASNDAAAIAAALTAAQAAAATADDRYIIAQLRLKAAMAAQDDAAIDSAIEAIKASQFLQPKSLALVYLVQGNQASKAKRHDAAAAAFEQGLALDPANASLLANLAEARNAQGKAAESVALYKRMIAARVAAGQKPEEDMYKRAVQIANAAKLADAIEVSRMWVTAYPSAESWRNSLGIYRNIAKPDLQGALDLLRLIRFANGLSQPTDYALYATAAADQGNYVEAQAVIEEGVSKGTITRSSPVIGEVLAALKTKQIAKESDLEQAAKEVKDAKGFMRVGDHFYGLGNYARAADLYRRAEAAGGAADLANLHLGMALARSGDKAGAASAFAKVGGARAPIAKYWALYVSQQG